MNLQHETMQQALETLVDTYEKDVFESRFRERLEEACKEEIIKADDTIVRYERQHQENSSRQLFMFSIEVEREKVHRGILGYSSILYTRRDQRMRNALLAKESIRGVITIKQHGNNYHQIAIILFDKDNTETWFASCNNTKEASAILSGRKMESTKVYYSETVYPENLLPDYYSDEHKEITSALLNTNTKKLEEIAEIIPGKSARSYDYRDTGIPYLRARDIQKGEIITASVFLPPEMASDFSKQLLQEGDILLTKHFGQRKLALVREENLPAIASEALYILRPFGISEGYLYRYLTSKTGQIVFNAQLKRVEKGAIVSSISLSDLKTIPVPIYDNETMHEIERMDCYTVEEGLKAALRIMQIGKRTEGIKLEKQVYDDLISAGWEAEKLSSYETNVLSDGGRYFADFSYDLPDDTKVFFEVKSSFSRITKDWISSVISILRGPTKCFLILTTGYYYEVHIAGREESLKLLHVPTITEIMNWEGELN